MASEKFDQMLGVMITPSMLAQIEQFVTEPGDRSRVVRRALDFGLHRMKHPPRRWALCEGCVEDELPESLRAELDAREREYALLHEADQVEWNKVAPGSIYARPEWLAGPMARLKDEIEDLKKQARNQKL